MVKRHFSVSPKIRSVEVMDGFSKLWTSLFTTPVHLDSALSKQSPKIKSILAQIVPQILLRPTSMAEVLGIGIPPGEPWSLSAEQLAEWRPARLMVERCYALMESGIPISKATSEDFPPWMVQEWTDQGILKPLVAGLGISAPLSLRITRRKDRREFLKELAKSSLPVRSELSDIVATGIRLSGYAPILRSDAFTKGEFEIQDEGSQILAHFALWPEEFQKTILTQPGSMASFPVFELPPVKDIQSRVIIDACAGAGGKTLALADAVGGKGRVYAYDVSLSKLQALKRRAGRAGLNNIQVKLLEEGKEADSIAPFHGQADLVMVDAPCSGWGVLRRNPDIKWRQRPEVLSRFPELQLRLLELYSQLVAPSGTLTFGLCTFRAAETRQVVEQFLAKNSNFQSIAGGFIGPGPCDGFFMHAFKRIR